MNPPFNRRCIEHEDAEIRSSFSASGHRETLWCGTGHKVSSWHVVDAKGRKLAIGYQHKEPEILDTEMYLKLRSDATFRVNPPDSKKVCKRGHNDWYPGKADAVARCRACKREEYSKNKLRIKERNAKKAAQKLKETVERKLKEKRKYV